MSDSSETLRPNDAPARIYLQWNGDDEPPFHGEPLESEVSWSRDEVFEHDVEYVRADTVAALQKRVEELEGAILEFSSARSELAKARESAYATVQGHVGTPRERCFAAECAQQYVLNANSRVLAANQALDALALALISTVKEGGK